MSQALSDMHDLAHAAGIDPDDLPKVRYANPAYQSDRTEAARGIYKLIAEGGEKSSGGTVSGSMGAHELRRLARNAGLDMGDERADDEEFASTVRHEAGHAATAHALGWTVTFVDARSGETRVEFPPLQSQSLADRDLQYACIAASGTAFTDSRSDGELAGDRYQVRALGLGHIEFADARAKAQRLAAHPWAKGIYDRLVAALLIHGRLEGAELDAALRGD
jgi:hypothetical protein